MQELLKYVKLFISRPQTETNDYLKTYLCLCTVVFCVHTVYIFISIISNLGMDINLMFLFMYVFVHSLTHPKHTHPLTHFYFHSFISCFGLNKCINLYNDLPFQ